MNDIVIKKEEILLIANTLGHIMGVIRLAEKNELEVDASMADMIGNYVDDITEYLRRGKEEK